MKGDQTRTFVDAIDVERLQRTRRARVHLASPLAEWITGTDLVVDGGVSAVPTW